MRKIQLDLDALDVQSFATTGGGPEERGTVHARGGSGDCLGTLYQAECVSLTADLECRCVQTEANQYSCGAVCNGTSISGHLDCQCGLTV
jgi:hypothetical protein